MDSWRNIKYLALHGHGWTTRRLPIARLPQITFYDWNVAGVAMILDDELDGPLILRISGELA